VGVSALLTLPINSLMRQLLGAETLTTSLPLGAALILVALSMAITLIAGLVPARSAAKKDPVAALRSE
jgi:putative ABC transport system permease protein